MHVPRKTKALGQISRQTRTRSCGGPVTFSGQRSVHVGRIAAKERELRRWETGLQEQKRPHDSREDGILASQADLHSAPANLLRMQTVLGNTERLLNATRPTATTLSQHAQRGGGSSSLSCATCTTPLNVANDKTFDVITGLFNECTGGAKSAKGKPMGLFPDDFLHLGGDEVNTDCWTKARSNTTAPGARPSASRCGVRMSARPYTPRSGRMSSNTR